MKKLFKKHFLLGAIALSVLIFGGGQCNPEKNSNTGNQSQPGDTLKIHIVGPQGIAGIIIDGTGTPLSTGGEKVQVTDAILDLDPGTVFTVNKNDVYKIPISDTTAAPYTLLANLVADTFYSCVNVLNSCDSTWVVLNSGPGAPATLDLVFLNHDRSPVTNNMSVSLYNNATGTGTSLPGGSWAYGNGDNALHYRYTGIQPSATYSFRCSNAAGPKKDACGRNIARMFNTTKSIGANSTVGYTFFVN
jgi:hypothetical protein